MKKLIILIIILIITGLALFLFGVFSDVINFSNIAYATTTPPTGFYVWDTGIYPDLFDENFDTLTEADINGQTGEEETWSTDPTAQVFVKYVPTKYTTVPYSLFFQETKGGSTVATTTGSALEIGAFSFWITMTKQMSEGVSHQLAFRKENGEAIGVGITMNWVNATTWCINKISTTGCISAERYSISTNPTIFYQIAIKWDMNNQTYRIFDGVNWSSDIAYAHPTTWDTGVKAIVIAKQYWGEFYIDSMHGNEDIPITDEIPTNENPISEAFQTICPFSLLYDISDIFNNSLASTTTTTLESVNLYIPAVTGIMTATSVPAVSFSFISSLMPQDKWNLLKYFLDAVLGFSFLYYIFHRLINANMHSD